MDRRGVLLAVVLLVLIVAEGSDASLLEKFRILVGVGSNENSTVKEITPSPSPVASVNSTTSSSNVNETSTKKAQKPEVLVTSSKTNQNGSHDEAPKIPRSENPANKSDNPTGSKPATDETCKMSSSRCMDQKLIACIRHYESGSPELFLLVQNEGESTLKVNVTAPAFVRFAFKEIEILKHQAKTINFSANIRESFAIVLNTGTGNCTLHLGPPVSQGNFFQRFPSYATRVTPIYGAYVLFLIALIVGGTWACCKLGKRGRQGDAAGVPYQELEMALPESVSAVNVDPVGGWDQGWDDDWDEEKAVKSPGGHRLGNVSANGLTSRSSNRDGWEHDWDD